MIFRTKDVVGERYSLNGIEGKIQRGRRIPIAPSNIPLENGKQMWFVGEDDPSLRVYLPYLTTIITSRNIFSVTINSGQIIKLKLEKL